MNSFKAKLTSLRDAGVSTAKKGLGRIEQALMSGPMERSRQMEDQKRQSIIDNNFEGNPEAFNKYMDSVPEADKTDMLTRGARTFADKLTLLRAKSSAPK